MPRFFQHIEKGSDALGKVTRLKYIDDISDPDMILYYFEDGTYCNSEFIAPYDTQDPLQSKKAMIEVASPNSLWQFKKREKVTLDTDKKIAQGNDGNIYEAPPILSKDGKEITPEDEARVEYDVVRAARIPENYKCEPDDIYTLSTHPELEKTSSVTQKTDADSFSFIKKKPKKEENSAPVENFDFDSECDTSALKVKPVQAPAANQETIRKYTDEINALRKENEELKNRLKEIESSAGTQAIYSIPDEDPFIRNMVTKSKKKTCKITLGIKFDLPPKEVYDTIKNAYEDGMAAKFVSSLTARIPRENLLESLNAGLTKFYEGVTQKKENQLSEPQE